MLVRRSALTAALATAALAASLSVPAAAFATDATPAPPAPAATAPTTPAPETDCDALPDRVKGAPADLKGGAVMGDYIWHDATGWHLRVTHPGDTKRVFTGVIHSRRPMVKAPVALEKADSVRLSKDRKTLTFRFVNYGHIDGVDFTTDCSQALTFELRTNGHQLGRRHVYLGAHRVHPAQVPFTIRRHEPVAPVIPAPVVPAPTVTTPSA